jgi:hypothetical protein
MASFATQRTLTVALAGTGSGTVTSTPAGINCGTQCSAILADGDSVSLAATPVAGSVFAGWSGDCTGTGACRVGMTAARSVTATFTATVTTTAPLTVAVSGNGTVTSNPAGINCGADCSETVVTGTAVTLTATAAAGHRFVGWSGACSGSNTTCTVTVSAATSAQASFEPQPVMYVGALSGTRTVGSRSWSASATVTMLNGAQAPVSGVLVSFTTSGASSGTVSCTTTAAGTCTVTRDNLRSNRGSITFAVSSATAAGYSYTPARNVLSSITATR